MPKTTVNASCENTTVKGRSGNGRNIGRLLRGSRNPDAREFLLMLEKIKKRNSSGSRSPFSCAEPHAFALLLAKGKKLHQITLVGEAKQTHLSRTISECDNCSQWLHNNQYSEPYFEEEVTESDARRSADLSDHSDFVLDMSDFPALPTKD